jgi:hypothetical protein
MGSIPIVASMNPRCALVTRSCLAGSGRFRFRLVPLSAHIRSDQCEVGVKVRGTSAKRS